MIELITTFSSRLNEALTIRGMNAVDLVKRTGISDATISQYRSGYAKPKEDKLMMLSNALDVNPVWLMGLNVPMECDSSCKTAKPQPIDISRSEYKLIVAFRSADKGTKNSVMKLLDLENTEKNIVNG